MKHLALITSIFLTMQSQAHQKTTESLKLCDLALNKCATTIEYYEDYTKTLNEQIVLYDSTHKTLVDRMESSEKRVRFYQEFGPYILIFSFLTGTYFGHKYLKDN